MAIRSTSSHIYASGNIVADMYCNASAEATSRTLAARLYNSTSDPGKRDMLHFMIARLSFGWESLAPNAS